MQNELQITLKTLNEKFTIYIIIYEKGTIKNVLTFFCVFRRHPVHNRSFCIIQIQIPIFQKFVLLIISY